MKDLLKQSWHIDSECFKHMMGDASKFIHITPKNSGHVTYGDNNKGKILRVINVQALENTYIHEKELESKEKENKKETSFQEESRTIDLPKEWKASKNHPLDNIIGDISKGVTT